LGRALFTNLAGTAMYQANLEASESLQAVFGFGSQVETRFQGGRPFDRIKHEIFIKLPRLLSHSLGLPAEIDSQMERFFFL
jgi:hypothetical protein